MHGSSPGLTLISADPRIILSRLSSTSAYERTPYTCVPFDATILVVTTLGIVCVLCETHLPISNSQPAATVTREWKVISLPWKRAAFALGSPRAKHLRKSV